MLTFDDVVNAPVGRLKEAADDWSDMAAKLARLADDARQGMRAKSEKARWEGVNSDVTKPFIARTAKEVEDARAQAEGIALLLADALASFRTARDALVGIRDEEGPAAGIHVDAKGRVRPRYDLEGDIAARHDPGYAEALRKQNEAVSSWQRRIDRVVEDCSDADDSLKRALAANTKDAHGFTAPTYKTLDAEQVDRAAELMRKVTGDGGTARNVAALRELEDLLDDNRDDPEFAPAFYRKLGAEGTLEAYARMSLDATSLGPAGQDRVNTVRSIQGDMGAMLGLATQASTPHHLGDAWTAQLLRAGRQKFDVPGVGYAQVYGYQALGALLREGKYDKEFLLSVGRDMIAMDKKDPGVWSRNMPTGPKSLINLDETGGRGFNPLTGLMQAMGNNPEASTAFFDEPLREDTDKDGIVTAEDGRLKGKRAQDVIDYLLDKKPDSDVYDAVSYEEPNPGQAALGNALEAAVTGRVPGDEDAPPVSHSKTMSGLMERIVEKVGTEPGLVKEDGRLNGLSQNFGNMAAEYMPDLQATAENGAHQIKPFGEPAKFKKDEMAFFLGAVGQDPQAYGTITNAQQAYTTALVSDVFQNPDKHGDTGEAVRNAVHPGGEIAGMMTEARAQGVHEAQIAEDEEYNQGVADNAKWVNRIIDAVGAKYVEMLPVGGDVVGWIKEDIAESAVEGAEHDSTDGARRDSAARYTESESAVKMAARSAVGAAARGAGLPPEQIDEYQGSASTQSVVAHSVGRDLISSSSGKGS
ncbi:DUF6571 family protein [Streptomyces sp. NPDC092952]|uniref:DUF6571 family protein n=1 Tax=Streptomyces sp. NPDC092952 TaxID=3366018 RepID=UPI003829EC46